MEMRRGVSRFVASTRVALPLRQCRHVPYQGRSNSVSRSILALRRWVRGKGHKNEKLRRTSRFMSS